MNLKAQSNYYFFKQTNFADLVLNQHVYNKQTQVITEHKIQKSPAFETYIYKTIFR